jgi:hypothetical protein
VCRDAVVQAENEVQHVRARTSELRGRVEARASAYPNVFLQHTSSNNNRAGVGDVNVVQKSLAVSKREMDSIMRRLTWWRIIRRVDKIKTTVGNAVRKLWCRDLEQHVKFLVDNGLPFLKNLLIPYHAAVSRRSKVP